MKAVCDMEYLEEKMQQWIDEGMMPGCAFGLITREEACYRALGRARTTPEQVDVKIETVYDLASLTKVVGTVPAILHLVERGELTLETEVSKVLQEVQVEGLTIRHLLTHTSGAPADFAYQALSGKGEIVQVASSLLPEERTGSIRYSDINYILLGEIIERVGGLPLDQAFDQWIFKPLGMKHTGFFPERESCAPTEIREDRGLVWGEPHDGKAYAMGGVSGHAGLFSTVKDLGRFVHAMLMDGHGKKVQFLSAASIALLSREQADDDHDRRGLGWMLPVQGGPMGDLCSERTLFHTGFAGGSILIDLDRGAGFVVLTNRIHPTRENRGILGIRSKFNNLAIVVAENL